MPHEVDWCLCRDPGLCGKAGVWYVDGATGRHADEAGVRWTGAAKGLACESGWGSPDWRSQGGGWALVDKVKIW